jgi:predicted small lipoprotein YifL
MRSVARWLVLAALISWQTAACWAIGPMGFSDLPPASSDAPRGQRTQSADVAAPPLIPTADANEHDPSVSGGCGCQAGCGCQSCCKYKLADKLLIGVFCNMSQHYAYPSPWDRYYYFRPYNYFQVTQLQKTVAGWGQDPRNISDNSFFQAIYDQVDPSGKQAPSTHAPVPKPEPVPTPEPAAPVKPIERRGVGPTLHEPRVKVTRSAEPIEPARNTAPPATQSVGRSDSTTTAGAHAPQSGAGDGSQVELIRFVVP